MRLIEWVAQRPSPPECSSNKSTCDCPAVTRRLTIHRQFSATLTWNWLWLWTFMKAPFHLLWQSRFLSANVRQKDPHGTRYCVYFTVEDQGRTWKHSLGFHNEGHVTHSFECSDTCWTTWFMSLVRGLLYVVSPLGGHVALVYMGTRCIILGLCLRLIVNRWSLWCCSRLFGGKMWWLRKDWMLNTYLGQ